MGILAQEDNQATGTNIQTYTPSKLLSQGQWDIKCLTISTPKQKVLMNMETALVFLDKTFLQLAWIYLLESAKTTVSMLEYW